ncbi:helix-turn-helix domain-containing protein [Candidatus Woesearchaeota archaeon]|nr:helix-turn-helix domain-containing protein [Candidatus Woesearchaeota archaeon]
MRIWHIWDLPDTIYIKFKEDYNKKLFHFLFEKFGGIRPTGRKFGLTQQGIKNYYRQYFKKNKRIYDQYIPLYIIKRFKPELSNKIINELEEGIEFISVRSGTRIKIKLSLMESREMYRIVAHMIGDGYGGIRKVPYYANTCIQLRQQFKKDLITIFGIKIKKYIYETTPNTTPIVNFPKALSDILKHIFQIEFTRPNKLPILLFGTSKENKIEFIKALFDDEGFVSTTVGISMKSKNIIQQLKRLLEELNIGTTNISKSQRDIFTVNIQEKMVEKFQKIINFDHPIKNKRLLIRMKIKNRNRTTRTRPLEYTRRRILELLKEKPSTTFELCEVLLLSMGGLYHHLNYLEENKVIERTGFKNKAIWQLKA